jgi:hypothetical protein
MLGALRQRSASGVAGSALLCTFALWLAPAPADAHVVVRFSASLSPSRVLHVRGVVHPAGRGLRVGLQLGTRRASGREAWASLGTPVPVGTHGSFAVTAAVPASDAEVVVRAVVIRGRRLLANGSALLVRVPGGSVLGSKVAHEPEPVLAPAPPPGLAPGPVASPPLEPVPPGSVLASGSKLLTGEYLLSPDHAYKLVMQGDGNLVLYHEGSAVWATYTSGSGNYLAMQGEGNLVVYNGGTALWNTATWGFAGAYLALQDDGNLVVYQDGHAIWTYGSGYKGQILNPGEKLEPGAYLVSPDHEYQLIMQGDGNLVLYHGGSAVWATYTSGPGNYLVMQGEGNLVEYPGGGGEAKWNTVTWGFPGAYLQLQDDGNVVVYQDGHAIWTYSSGYKGQILNPGEKLEPGAYLLSPDHQYELIMQGEGNLVLYHGGSALWATYTSGAGSYATMQSDGNFVVYDGGTALWNSATAGSSGAYLQLQDDSNLVIYEGGAAIWDWESGKIGGGGGNVGERILAEAEKWAGTPYCFAGGEPSGPSHGKGNVEGATQCGGSTKGFDCTGLTLYAVYQVTGKVLTHEGLQAENAVAQGGQHIYSKTELQPGDLVYFGGSFNDIEHVGIYAGGGMMWDANIAFWIYPDGVHERSMASIENEKKFDGAVRF